MNDIFHDMPMVIVYINDILIFTKYEKGHDEIVLEVLCRLKENDLFVKPEKCFFKVWEVEMLSLIIGPDGIKMDPKKVEVITAWPIPTKVKEVQSFLGLANFYRRFVDNLSKVAKPLHKLTHKDTVTNKTVAIFVLIDLFGQYLENQWAKCYKPIYVQNALNRGFSNH